MPSVIVRRGTPTSGGREAVSIHPPLKHLMKKKVEQRSITFGAVPTSAS